MIYFYCDDMLVTQFEGCEKHHQQKARAAATATAHGSVAPVGWHGTEM